MTKSYNLLRDQLTPEQKATANKKADAMLAEMPLQELRKAKAYTQSQLAELLNTQQAGLSRLEQQTDMYISTLKSYIEAMGGELDIIARFPSGDVSITQFNVSQKKDSSA